MQQSRRIRSCCLWKGTGEVAGPMSSLISLRSIELCETGSVDLGAPAYVSKIERVSETQSLPIPCLAGIDVLPQESVVQDKGFWKGYSERFPGLEEVSSPGTSGSKGGNGMFSFGAPAAILFR